jgi:hypothetical protein
VIATVQEFVTGRRAPAPTNRRLLTILFLDIVGLTERAAELGDAAWRELLAAHYARAEREIVAYEGREVDRAGDGIVAVFEGPTRAIRCAQALQREAGTLALELRGGIHTGEAELDGRAIRGIADHGGARVRRCGSRRGASAPDGVVGYALEGWRHRSARTRQSPSEQQLRPAPPEVPRG